MAEILERTGRTRDVLHEEAKRRYEEAQEATGEPVVGWNVAGHEVREKAVQDLLAEWQQHEDEVLLEAKNRLAAETPPRVWDNLMLDEKLALLAEIESA